MNFIILIDIKLIFVKIKVEKALVIFVLKKQIFTFFYSTLTLKSNFKGE